METSKQTTYRERLNRIIGRFPKCIKEWPVSGVPSLAAIKCKATKHIQAYPQARAVFLVS